MARPQGRRPAAVFCPFRYPKPYAYVSKLKWISFPPSVFPMQEKNQFKKMLFHFLLLEASVCYPSLNDCKRGTSITFPHANTPKGINDRVFEGSYTNRPMCICTWQVALCGFLMATCLGADA
jgi:hypothetical protein